MPLFDDMLTSYRGASTIATFLAAFVLVSLLILSVLVLDPRFNGSIESSTGFVARQEREIARLTREVGTAEARFQTYQQRKAQSAALDSYLKQEADAQIREEKLSSQVEDCVNQLTQVRARRARHAQAYRQHIRDEAIGETLPTMSLPDGRVLESPQIVRASPAGLQLRYSAGVVRIPVKDLPGSLRQRFQFTETEADQFLASERDKLAEFERDIDRNLAAINETGRRKRIEHLEGRIPLLRRRIEACLRELDEQHRRPLPHLRTVIDLRDRIALDKRALSQADSELQKLREDD